MTKVLAIFYYLFLYPYYRIAFRKFGNRARIISPLALQGMRNMEISDRVIIQYKTWLAALPLTGTTHCELKIGEGSAIGNFNHIYATQSIEIGKGVLTADKVYITDNLHEYQDVSRAIINQPIRQLKPVKIGDGCWLGENVCILGANVGKGSVIGANSVVTKDIPDYSVAVGSPAKIIKRYCVEQQTWRPTNESGDFI